MQVLDRNGVHLPDADLWLDPHHARPLAIVSHAHADHMKAHGQTIATPATAAMMRLRGARGQFHELPFHTDYEFENGAKIQLWPAGHVLGSSQVLVEHDGWRLLYSGDFKLRDSRSSESIAVPPADIVVMETTFGRPQYRFPDNESVLDEMRRWCKSVLNTGSQPVLFCYSLGKGQEVLAGMKEADFPVYLHEAHWKMSNLYRELGADFPNYRLYEPGQKLDGVLLCASGCKRGRWFDELRRTHSLKTAYVSGWALDRNARFRFGTDHAFPLSDHADYDDLMAYVGLTGAGTVFTTHGFDEDFAHDLRRQGYLAQPLKHAVAL